MVDLSIIIVNYNTYLYTKNLINSIYKTTKDISFEIIVIDNSSNKATLSKLVDLQKVTEYKFKLVKNPRNDGFSVANNIGINQSCGEYILMINSDTIVLNQCIQNCLKHLQSDDKIGALGPKLLLENGNLDHACKRGFPTPSASFFYFTKLYKIKPNSKILGQYLLTYISDDQVSEIDSLTGAFMMIPRSVLNQVGLLDEDFFMYGEDIDLCYRIKQAGYKIIYYPKETSIHYKGQSTSKKNKKIIYEFHRSMHIFYDKHYKTIYPIWVSWIMHSIISVKYHITRFINLLKKE